MVFALLWNLTGADTFPKNELGQACRTAITGSGPGVSLGCNADASGESWDTWKGRKVGVASLEPKWENPTGSASGSTWGTPTAGTGYY